MARAILYSALLVLLILPIPAVAESLSLTILAPPATMSHPAVAAAVNDAVRLLKEGFPTSQVSLNDRSAQIRLILPSLAPAPAVPRLPLVPGDDSYRWRGMVAGKGRILQLNASTPGGVSCGIYGLFQEQLGFRFYHPRKSYIPRRSAWPLPSRFAVTASPRFRSRGFHLHTLHPTELAEQLNDPTYPGGLGDVREYIDWLARNRQNTMQFYLLRGVDRGRWIPYARRIVDYAHGRGVSIGVQVSMSMVQQQAFRLFSPITLYPSYREQTDRSLAWLFGADWDFVTVEPLAGEFLPDWGRIMPELRDHIAQQVTGRYGRKIFFSTHVIGGEGHQRQESLPPQAGILVHTVMCWSAGDLCAPVYGNANQCFMLERGMREARQRETWYWPESSYWVAFDTPVPLFLLSYLEARRADMGLMEEAGVTGHLTFTSGWEWGYWLIDWSIAHWSWDRNSSTLGALADILPSRELLPLWQEALVLQNRRLKGEGLVADLAAATPFSELPSPFRRTFQPQPEVTIKEVARAGSAAEAQRLASGRAAELETYAGEIERLTGRMRKKEKMTAKNAPAELLLLHDELVRGLEIGGLRARHRALVLRAAAASGAERERLLAAAEEVRQKGLTLVRRQESLYRYPVTLVARRRPSLTAYPFGYLYAPSELFFWRREEEQVRRDRFDPFFMNLWDPWRVLGVSSPAFTQK